MYLLVWIHVGEARVTLLAALAADFRDLLLRAVGEVGRVALRAAHFRRYVCSSVCDFVVDGHAFWYGLCFVLGSKVATPVSRGSFLYIGIYTRDGAISTCNATPE